jgi:hypothetical protein
MYQPEKCHPWIFNPAIGGKRPLTHSRSVVVRRGCYALEHVATGRFYVMESPQVSQAVDQDLAALVASKHSCRLLQGLYDRDPVLRVYEAPATTKQASKALLEAFRYNHTTYLLINP